MWTVQQKGISPLSAPDSASFTRKFLYFNTDAAKYQIAKLTSVLFVESVKLIDITDKLFSLRINLVPQRLD